jgi:hypothetical protein
MLLPFKAFETACKDSRSSSSAASVTSLLAAWATCPLTREMKMNTMLKVAVVAVSLAAGAAFAQTHVEAPVATPAVAPVATPLAKAVAAPAKTTVAKADQVHVKQAKPVAKVVAVKNVKADTAKAAHVKPASTQAKAVVPSAKP